MYKQEEEVAEHLVAERLESKKGDDRRFAQHPRDKLEKVAEHLKKKLESKQTLSWAEWDALHIQRFKPKDQRRVAEHQERDLVTMVHEGKGGLAGGVGVLVQD